MKLDISKEVGVDADDLVTGRTCIIGQSGSGKSYTVAVVCEELAKNNIGFCIIDTEGEYFSLKEKYPILWVGSDGGCEINIESVDYKKLAVKTISKGFPLIFDVSEVDNPNEKVAEFLKELYNASSKIRTPYLLIIEEIDKFAPQKGIVLPEVEEISRRGRKRGLGLLIATQRPALVNKNVLSQCGNQIIGKLTIKNDIESVRSFFTKKEDLERLPRLKPGEFFVQGNISETKLVKIRKRETAHKAITPKIVGKKIIQTKDLEELEIELQQKGEAEEKPEVEEVTLIGVQPKISPDEAFKKIKESTRRFRILWSDGLVSGLHLVLRPISSCEIKYLKKKIIGHEFLTIPTYFDGITGDVLSLEKGYSVQLKTKEFLGLETNDLEIFNIISKSRKTTTVEIAYKIKKSPESVRISLKELFKRNLIRYKRVGRNIVYYPFTKARLPKLDKIGRKSIETNRLKINANKLEFKIDSKDLSAFIRSIGEKADIVSEKKIYYPFYKATILRKDSKKEVCMDAVTGKFVRLD